MHGSRVTAENAMSLTYLIACSQYKTGNHEKLMPKTRPLHQMVSVYVFPPCLWQGDGDETDAAGGTASSSKASASAKQIQPSGK